MLLKISGFGEVAWVPADRYIVAFNRPLSWLPIWLTAQQFSKPATTVEHVPWPSVLIQARLDDILIYVLSLFSHWVPLYYMHVHVTPTSWSPNIVIINQVDSYKRQTFESGKRQNVSPDGHTLHSWLYNSALSEADEFSFFVSETVHVYSCMAFFPYHLCFMY